MPQEWYLSHSIQEFMGTQEVSTFLTEYFRPDNIHVASSAIEQAVYEANSALSALLPKAVHGGRSCKNSREFASQTPFGLVAEQEKYILKGVSLTRQFPYSQLQQMHPCSVVGEEFVACVWYREVASSPEETPHEFVGDWSSEDDTLKYAYTDTRETCIDPIRQHLGNDVHQQEGGTWSSSLCTEPWHLFRNMQAQLRTITAIHTAWIQTKVADSPLRHMI